MYVPSADGGEGHTGCSMFVVVVAIRLEAESTLHESYVGGVSLLFEVIADNNFRDE